MYQNKKNWIPIIGLAGCMCVGKNTVADHIEKTIRSFIDEDDFKIFQIAFADTLKSIGMTLGLSFQDCYTQEGKARMNPLYNMTNRNILQRLSELRHIIHPDVYVNALKTRIDACIKERKGELNGLLFIITDVRFPNEVAYIKSMNGIVINITRPGYTTEMVTEDTPESEIPLPKDCYDVNLLNDGSLENMYYKLSHDILPDYYLNKILPIINE